MKKINLKRIIALFVIFLNLAISLYTLWTPGTIITNGKHDKGQNGIWIQHGWLGHHSWFKKYKKAPSKFRDKENMLSLQRDLQKHNIKYIYPHLCPTDFQGHISKVDHEQTKNFLKVFNDFKVMPWVGGVLGEHCFPESKKWRKTFIESVIILLESHPSFSGIHLNIEPLPSGNKSLLVLLDELKLAMPTKTLSVAAYPPPTLWHPYKEVHWEKEYFKEVSRRVDQLVPMMYDTGIKLPKFYQKLMTDWSHEVLQWSGNTEILLGIPAYNDYGVHYHDPKVENISNALAGIHSFLNQHSKLPDNYSGISIYCEWQMTEGKWQTLNDSFLKKRQK